MTHDRWYNPLMRWLLRSPFHVLVSDSILLLNFTGRKSGQTYSTPINYSRQGQLVQLVTQRGRAWWHNFASSAPVTVRLHGQELPGVASVADVGRSDLIAAICRIYRGIPVSKAIGLADETVLINVRLAEGERQRAPRPAHRTV